jgi:hypothetical protein
MIPMAISKIVEMVGANSDQLTFWGVLILILSIGVEFTPIKINPWSSLLGWIGSKLNSKLNAKLAEIDNKVDKLSDDLDRHIAESNSKELKDTRRDILEFCNSCMNGRKHTKEQFEFVIKQCDEYEKYIEENGIKNGVVDAATKEIRRLNLKCIQENSYLREGEDYE